jgi:hypothetical protein
MRCEECLPILEEYFDGELESRRAELISAHVAGCSHCGAAAEALRIEGEAYSRYERDLDVNPRLWEGIAARIREERPAASRQAGLREWLRGLLRTPRLSPAFAVLLVIVAIAVTVVVLRRSNQDQPPPQQTAADDSGNNARPPQVAPPSGNAAAVPKEEEKRPATTIAGARPTKPKSAPTPEDLIRDAQRKYEQAIAILSRDVNRRRPEMDPQALARFDAALGAIDRTIADTRRAVRRQPSDPVALQYLLAAYSRKVDVLRDMTAF